MKAFALAFLIASCFISNATAEVHTLTLREAINLAMQQNPDVLLIRLDEQKARAQVLVARDSFTPKLGLGSGLAYTYGFPVSLNGNAPSIIRSQANMSLFDRPQSYRAAQASEAVRGSGIDVALRQHEALYRVYTAFLDAELAVRDMEAVNQQAQSLIRVLEYYEARAAEGLERNLTVKRSQVDVSNAGQAQKTYAAAQRQVEVALAQLLGYPDGDQVHPATESRAPLPMPESEEASINKAIEDSLEIRRLESGIQAKMLEVKSYQAERLPKIKLFADYSLLSNINNYEQYYQNFQTNNFQIGASFELPIMTGRAPKALASQAESDIAKLRIQVNQTRGKITGDVKQAYSDLNVAEGARQVAREDLELQEAQTASLRIDFEEGRVPMAQVEASKAAEQQKWVVYYGAQRDFETARLNILKTTGELLAAVR